MKKRIFLILFVLLLFGVISFLIYKNLELTNLLEKTNKELEKKDLYYEHSFSSYEDSIDDLKEENKTLKEENSNIKLEKDNLSKGYDLKVKEYESLKEFLISDVLFEEVESFEDIDLSDKNLEKGIVSEIVLGNIVSTFDEENFYLVKSENEILGFNYFEDTSFRILHISDTESYYYEDVSIGEFSKIITDSFNNESSYFDLWLRYDDKNKLYSAIIRI